MDKQALPAANALPDDLPAADERAVPEAPDHPKYEKWGAWTSLPAPARAGTLLRTNEDLSPLSRMVQDVCDVATCDEPVRQSELLVDDLVRRPLADGRTAC